MVNGAHGHVSHVVRLVVVGHNGVLEVVVDLHLPVGVKIVVVHVSTIFLATVFAVQVRDTHNYYTCNYDCILCTCCIMVRYLTSL